MGNIFGKPKTQQEIQKDIERERRKRVRREQTHLLKLAGINKIPPDEKTQNYCKSIQNQNKCRNEGEKCQWNYSKLKCEGKLIPPPDCRFVGDKAVCEKSKAKMLYDWREAIYRAEGRGGTRLISERRRFNTALRAGK